MNETTEVPSEQPASRGGHFPGDVVNGHVLGDDLEWHLAEQPSAGKKIEGWLYVALAFGIVVVLPIALIFWIGSAIFGEKEQSPLEAEASAIVTDCFNIVQPVDYPRISGSEEQRIIDCALRATEDPALTAAILHELAPMDGR